MGQEYSDSSTLMWEFNKDGTSNPYKSKDGNGDTSSTGGGGDVVASQKGGSRDDHWDKGVNLMLEWLIKKLDSILKLILRVKCCGVTGMTNQIQNMKVMKPLKNV